MGHLPNIFNANIAKKIDKAMGKLLLPVVLQKFSQIRDPDNSSKNIKTFTPHKCRGFTEDYDEKTLSGTLVAIGDKKITVLGASFSVDNVYPVAGDRITIEGETRTVIKVKRDPAGATFECQSR